MANNQTSSKRYRPRCVSASRPPGRPSTTRSSSSVISNPRSHTCRLNRLAESGGLRLPRRPVVLPLPPCCVALRRDLLRRSPSAFVPRHRARHHPRAPPASLLRRRVRPGLPIHGPPFTQNPGSQVAQAAARPQATRAVAPRTQLKRLVRRDRLDSAARLRGGSQTRTPPRFSWSAARTGANTRPGGWRTAATASGRSRSRTRAARP